MEKSTHSPLYDHLRERLVEIRNDAGMSQRDLAKAVGREHSFVSRYELGERRLDVVEIFWILRALGTEPEGFLTGLVKEFKRIERKKSR